jgi:acetolactate decarboxylase
MFHRNVTLTLLLVSTIGCSGTQLSEQPADSHDIHIVGEMRQVMREGKLEGSIRLDTLRQREHLYGLGPLAFLKGEIMIIDGESYISTVSDDSSMVVERTYEVEAPFFGYGNVHSWSEMPLPDSVRTLTELENFLDATTKDRKRPFFFRLVGLVDEAVIHVVNLPDGSVVTSPDEAHVGQVDYPVKDVESELLGFFSTEHKAVFTHHDTYLHIHLITADRKMMGHVDELVLGNGVRLLVGD